MPHIESSVNNNFTSKTCTLTVSIVGEDIIESITYNHDNAIFEFSIQPSFSISAEDYINFSLVLDNFSANIFSVIKPTNISFSTFGIRQVRDTNNGNGILRFIYQKDANDVYNITGNYPNGTMSFAARTSSTSLNLEEWLFYHDVHPHFDKEVRKEFNL